MTLTRQRWLRFRRRMRAGALERRAKHAAAGRGFAGLATPAEVRVLIAEADARRFPWMPADCRDRHHQPCWPCQRLKGAQGD